MTFDYTIIEALKHQNRIIQKQVFEWLYTRMYRLCLRYVGSETEAEDCVMTGFLIIFKKITQFEYNDEKGFERWCKRIMVNESLKHLRSRHSFLSIVGDEEVAANDTIDALDKLENEELHSCILELPSGYRTVLNLYVIEGFSHKEIAEMLGITESTSKSQLLKAKHKLRINIERRRNYGLEARG